MARELFSRDSPEELLQRIVSMAVETVEGCEDAGILIMDRRKRSFETPAATSDLVRASDRAQAECDEGPCLEAAREEQVFRVDDMAGESRWPCYRPRALELGIGSMIGFDLYTYEDHLGALNLYSRSRDAFGGRALETGWVFASHAAVAIAGARREATLREGYATRQEIGEAIGIIMERQRVSSDEAFETMRFESMHSNTKLREVARRISRTGEIPGG